MKFVSHWSTTAAGFVFMAFVSFIVFVSQGMIDQAAFSIVFFSELIFGLAESGLFGFAFGVFVVSFE